MEDLPLGDNCFEICSIYIIDNIVKQETGDIDLTQMLRDKKHFTGLFPNRVHLPPQHFFSGGANNTTQNHTFLHISIHNLPL